VNDKQLKQAEAQLPAGARIIRAYKAYENGEIRMVVKLPGSKCETRYIVHFAGDDIQIEHRP
jgi:hypothetical protein